MFCSNGSLAKRNAEVRSRKNDGRQRLETAKLADSIRKKYNEMYEYADPIRGVARDERLKLKMGFDIMNAGFTEYTQIVNVYKDRNYLSDRITF